MEKLRLEEKSVHQNKHTQNSYLQLNENYFEEANKDEFWNKAMNEELDQIEKNDTCELVPRPNNKSVIDTKQVFRNKLNEYG